VSSEDDEKERRARYKKWAEGALKLCQEQGITNERVLFDLDHIRSAGLTPSGATLWFVKTLRRKVQEKANANGPTGEG
jgi:hypothetical protein